MNTQKAKTIELIFAASGILLLVGIILMLIYSLSFLSVNLLKALSFSPQASQQIDFNTEAFKKLNL